MKFRNFFGHRQRNASQENPLASPEIQSPIQEPSAQNDDFGGNENALEEDSKSISIPISDRELHWIMRTRSHGRDWQDIIAYIDPGNTVGPLISLERIFNLGYGTVDINFDNAILIMTHKGIVKTFGTIELTYGRAYQHTALTREFHIWEEDMGRFDVCFPASDDNCGGDLSFMRLGTGYLSRYESKVSRNEILASKKRTRDREKRWWIFVEYRINANIDKSFRSEDAYKTSRLETYREN